MKIVGIVPAAGRAGRLQPLSCPKELLPIIMSTGANGTHPAKPVAEYIIDRMINAGAEHICVVISPRKGALVHHLSLRQYPVRISYALQESPIGLCDAIFRAQASVTSDSLVLIGFPDTIWYPEDGFAAAGRLGWSISLMLFRVGKPSDFDAVVCDPTGKMEALYVKANEPPSDWIWGALTVPGPAFYDLMRLWESRHRSDLFLGDLLNAYVAEGGVVRTVRLPGEYLDVGTWEGYRAALQHEGQVVSGNLGALFSGEGKAQENLAHVGIRKCPPLGRQLEFASDRRRGSA